MLVVSIFDLGDGAGQQFRVSEVSGDGSTVDVTADYHVHAMNVQDETHEFVGWHIGRRSPLAPELNSGARGCIHG